MWLSWLPAVACCSLYLHSQAPCGSEWLPASPGLHLLRHPRCTTVSPCVPPQIHHGGQGWGCANWPGLNHSSPFNQLFGKGQEDTGGEQTTYFTTCPSKPHPLNTKVGLAPQRSFRILFPDTGRSNQQLSTEFHCTKWVNLEIKLW